MSKGNNLSNRDIVKSFIDKLNTEENKNSKKNKESKKNNISLTRQTELLSIPRSSLYYPDSINSSDSINPDDMAMMNEIDKVYTDYPFYGSRRIARHLARELKQRINRKRIQRLMRIMGIEAIYPKINLSKNRSDHPVYPYLLANLNIYCSNQVWGTDITYIKLKNGFLYLIAFLDWFSRFVISWQTSISLETEFCLKAARDAINNYGLPQIENSDQGSQFTSNDYLNLWKSNKVAISMDSRGRCMDNIFTERLWRSLKYEEVYLKDYQTPQEARENINSYFEFYNHKRIHQSLNYQTPAEVYFRNLPKH